MPRDNDKNNHSRGRRDRPPGGKNRSGAGRGPEQKFAKRGYARSFGGKSDGDEPFHGDRRDDGGAHRKRYPGRRDDGAPRRDYDKGSRSARFGRDDRSRGDNPRAERPNYHRDDRPARRDRRDGEGAPRDARANGRFAERGFRDKEHGSHERGDKPHYARRTDRGDAKPWQKREMSAAERGERGSRPARDEARPFEKRSFGKPRPGSRPEGHGADQRRRFSRSREDRPKFERPRERRDESRNFERPRHGRDAWQEHPRSETRSFERYPERPRRDNEDDSKIFAKRPAFGGRGAYRERAAEEQRAPRPPRERKSGERIAKVVSRAGLASRRDAEEWIVQGRVAVNGRVINSPALDVSANDVITIDGKSLPPRERTRLFLYHKPRGLMTTHADPEGRPTVFDNLPEGLPRLISIGRLDFNTEGLLLLTNDGGLARALELPDTGWLRRYRVRAHGEVMQAQLDELKNGIEVDGVKYGPIDATLERDQGANVWLVFAIREGKNREVRNVLAHLGLEVNRLIRVSYGPFQLGELAEGVVEEVRTRVLREQLGEKIARLAGADFTRPLRGEVGKDEQQSEPQRGKKSIKPAHKSGLIADRKGRRVLVQRTGSEEARARNEAEANGYGPPRRPQRGYHGKRDLKPRHD